MDTQGSLDERKFQLDIEMHQLAKKSYTLDKFSKVALPIVLALLALVTYVSNTRATADRMRFEMGAKQREFKQKEAELFLKKGDSERALDTAKATFIQTNLTLIQSPSTEDQSRLQALVHATFPRDTDDVMARIEILRAVARRTPSYALNASIEQRPSEYKAQALQLVKTGNFASASEIYKAITLINPSDSDAWNSLAYSEMRLGHFSEALSSVSTSINLQPTDKSLQLKVMTNATKILCSMGRFDDALSYINKSLAVAPDLLKYVEDDGEFRRRCNFSFPNPGKA